MRQTREPVSDPKRAIFVFEQAAAYNRLNEAVWRLTHDLREKTLGRQKGLPVQTEIIRKLADMGQTRFILLSTSYNKSRTVIALYAGNGIVVKVIPRNYLGMKDVIYHLPAITEEIVGGFVIKAYPWLPQVRVSEQTVARLGDKIRDLGLGYTDGDAHPRNVCTLPDSVNSPVGIDSKMYEGEADIPERLKDAWHRYIHTLYPIYQRAAIPPQTEDTDFSFFSIHKEGTGLQGFDHTHEDPIIRQKKPEPKKQRWWSNWLSTTSYEP